MVIRRGDRVFVSAMETGAGISPLCNTRPRVFVRDASSAWRMIWTPPDFLEREPCPIVSVGDSVFVSTNPLRKLNESRSGPSDPGIVCLPLFGAPAPQAEVPAFVPGASFTEHSYRAICADPYTGSVVLFHIDSPTGDYFVSQRLPSGAWLRRGRVHFPIRACYPNTMLRGNAAHILAIGDIMEPVAEWRAFKRQQSGKEWDYVFRRLFYARTPDINAKPFGTPIEIDNVEATAGWMVNLDLWVDATGAVHLLYVKTPVQSAQMRDKFFPQVKLTRSLEYVVVREDKIIARHTVAIGGEGMKTDEPAWARFHVLPGGRLLVLYAATDWSAASPRRVWRLVQVSPEITPPVDVPLSQGMSQFFTASERGGSRPSHTIDVFGAGDDGLTLGYARLRLSP
jgi:hypothetical protein